MDNENYFSEVMTRAKKALNVSEDKDLCELLHMKQNAFWNRKSANSIPYKEVIQLAREHNLNLHWLFTGIGSMNSTPMKITQSEMEVLDVVHKIPPEKRGMALKSIKQHATSLSEMLLGNELKEA